ncbi:deoxycytidine monophosphate deaminase PWA37_001840 [Arxiozyma heterogenica]|uniref:Deoxycytidylate deaminase n=1 Tax=Arxiozyma heterogenica TaxID=278026 RepID=A0AAN8A7J9_9SACH|nr:hypothetical protein RI543_001319 [Kazachstania heterogenica]
MLVAVSGTKYSGADLVVKLLVEKHGFELLDYQKPAIEILNYATENYRNNLVILCETLELLVTLEKRTFFVHLSVDASVGVRLKRAQEFTNNYNGENDDSHITNEIDKLIMLLDEHDFNSESIELREKSHFKLKIVGNTLTTLEGRLNKALEKQIIVFENKKFDNPEESNPPLRPDWDTYFMRLATLAASRSNCMKRRVGCVIVRDFRVIATGYNGTPRHLTNCFNGGCSRCNQGDSRNLHTCLCLHAEENALLEAGRDRVGSNATLYCDTCPCLTCSVKIVQTGITEVVYSQSYSMDEESFKVLKAGGVKVRQFSFIQEPRIIIV